jgi:hypothetical protein
MILRDLEKLKNFILHKPAFTTMSFPTPAILEMILEQVVK